MITERAPHAQVAMITLNLGGAAKELADMLTIQEQFFGAIVDGVQLEPVPYLIQGLQKRFAPLDEEARIAAMMEIMRFQRKGNEDFDSLVTRFDIARQKARSEGQFVMSIEGYTILLFSCIGMPTGHILEALQPLRGRLPRTQAQFEEILRYMRRM